MAQKRQSTKRKRGATEPKKTNWLLIGGILGVAVLALVGLLILGLREPARVTVEAYCGSNPAACVSIGEPDAPVTIVEVLDFGCQHCRNFHETTSAQISERYVADGVVRWLYLPYALRPETIPAANASMCAAEQDDYTAFSDAMFARFDDEDYLTRSSILAAGEAAGLEMDSFTGCVQAGTFDDTVRQNMEIAQQNRLNSTPTFLVNGRLLRGAQPFTAFQQLIEQELTEAN